MLAELGPLANIGSFGLGTFVTVIILMLLTGRLTTRSALERERSLADKSFSALTETNEVLKDIRDALRTNNQFMRGFQAHIDRGEPDEVVALATERESPRRTRSGESNPNEQGSRERYPRRSG